MSPIADREQPPWCLVTVRTVDGTEQVGIQRPETDEVRVPAWLDGLPGVLEVIAQWDVLGDRLRHHDPGEGAIIAGARLLAPLRYPRKVLCSGPNYHDHLAEMGESGLGEDWSGFFFFKPPTTTIIAHGDAIVVGPDQDHDRVDWEGELAAVIGDGGRDISRTDALAHVAGYTVANDISMRGPHRRSTPAAPFVWDWTASKAADTSLPLGPGLVPAWHVPDPQDLLIRTVVNGTTMQDGTTADMVLDVATLIADASAQVTLEPGDVVLTGTPAGVGASRGIYLHPGDVVDVEIPGVGRLRNPVRSRSGPAPGGRADR